MLFLPTEGLLTYFDSWAYRFRHVRLNIFCQKALILSTEKSSVTGLVSTSISFEFTVYVYFPPITSFYPLNLIRKRVYRSYCDAVQPNWFSLSFVWLHCSALIRQQRNWIKQSRSAAQNEDTIFNKLRVKVTPREQHENVFKYHEPRDSCWYRIL